MWIGVRQRFSRFHTDLALSGDELDDALRKQKAVRQSLERAYSGNSHDNPPGLIVGSVGRGTAVRPASDIDVFFELPPPEFARFDGYVGNGQSALLQEVRDAILNTYPNTAVRGDGQVVVVAFNTITVEVVPAFRGQSGQYLMPDTNGGGSWKTADPLAEQNFMQHADGAAIGNVRALARMMKIWKRHCNVPIKSFVVEYIVAHFMNSYGYRAYDWYWFDWYVRDFLQYLCGFANGSLTIPGTGEEIALGDSWLSRAQTARDRALAACEWERSDYTVTAGQEWQKIFGPRIPIHVL